MVGFLVGIAATTPGRLVDFDEILVLKLPVFARYGALSAPAVGVVDEANAEDREPRVEMRNFVAEIKTLGTE